MIILDDSEEAIKGLAKIIAQDPTFSIKLRNDKRRLLEERAIIENEEYFQKQEAILKKAEEIGLTSTGYIFEVYVNEEEDNYMVYKNVGNEMVPIRKEFKTNPHDAILFSGLINYLKGHGINNLITFQPSFQESFYSFPWYEKGDKESNDSWGHDAQHVDSVFDRDELKELTDNGISFRSLSQSEAWEFNLHLKSVTED
jgi:predicted Holliday junction resolvase-like endonuclease